MARPSQMQEASGIDRVPFLLRWIIAVGLTVICAGAVEYGYASRQTEHQILDGIIATYDPAIADLEALLSSDLPPEAMQAAITEELNGLAQDPSTEYVGLFDGSGNPVGLDGDTLTSEEAEKFQGVLASGQPSAQRDGDAGDRDQPDRYEFRMPVRSPDGLLVLEIDQQTEVIGAVLTHMRRSQLLGIGLGLVVGVPLSYLLGGRSLDRRHRRAQRDANTDALTGLPGRRPFRPAVDRMLATRADTTVALALIDIDEFKQVNDQLGHTYGDRVLRALASAFEDLRASDTAYRLGGDEFAVVMTDVSERQGFEVLERVARALSERAPGMTFSAGLAMAGPEDALEAQELWERADAALYDAKGRGRRQVVSFNAMTVGLTVSPEKTAATSALLKPDAPLSVAFQPIWDLRTGKVLGNEALLRLPPSTPLDGPQEAFDMAQRLGLAADLDECARRAILGAVSVGKWEGRLFINVHPDALARLQVEKLVDQVNAAGLVPDDVILEVTEHPGLDRPESIKMLLLAHERGFRLALDDMGKGNAGLRALTHVQFDVVKIDRDVIVRIGVDPASDATIAAAVAFVQQSGGWVVAEGIEDADVLGRVLGVGQGPLPVPTMAGQGYLLGRPGPVPTPSASRLDIEAALGTPAPDGPAQVTPAATEDGSGPDSP